MKPSFCTGSYMTTSKQQSLFANIDKKSTAKPTYVAPCEVILFHQEKYVGSRRNKILNYIPINDTSFELSVFWLSDTESQIIELRFSDSVSLSFKQG